MNILFVFALTLLLVDCATKPTIVIESPERQMKASGRMLEPIQLTGETVVVDARPRFDYSMAHIPRSVSLQWSDYTEPEMNQRGILQHDLSAAARRLARAGLGPDVPVVVVGRGLNGEGEEGRVAWMLAYLGFSRIQFAALDSFRARMTNTEELNPPPPVAIWNPQPIESLNVTRDEVKFALTQKATTVPKAFKPGGRAFVYRLIDVRGVQDYLNRSGFGASQPIPNMEAINIPWAHFFTKDLRPNPAIKTELMNVGITSDQRIILIDKDGVTSAAVTMALRALGYANAGNYAGGLKDLVR